jgi:polyferredoxin
MPPAHRRFAAAPAELEAVEGHVIRLYAAIVMLLMVLGGLVWGTVAAVQIAPRSLSDTVFALLALGGMALSATVLLLLAQLAQWTRRRRQR